ncbi:hypothetical protein LTR17_024467 [Elasticomyces elasticus]|nr:hypothetical protein LTR17_024467 [Elasticomyces elasticus]
MSSPGVHEGAVARLPPRLTAPLSIDTLWRRVRYRNANPDQIAPLTQASREKQVSPHHDELFGSLDAAAEPPYAGSDHADELHEDESTVRLLATYADIGNVVLQQHSVSVPRRVEDDILSVFLNSILQSRRHHQRQIMRHSAGNTSPDFARENLLSGFILTPRLRWQSYLDTSKCYGLEVTTMPQDLRIALP